MGASPGPDKHETMSLLPGAAMGAEQGASSSALWDTQCQNYLWCV